MFQSSLPLVHIDSIIGRLGRFGKGFARKIREYLDACIQKFVVRRATIFSKSHRLFSNGDVRELRVIQRFGGKELEKRSTRCGL
jgi:hypothetical protein